MLSELHMRLTMEQDAISTTSCHTSSVNSDVKLSHKQWRNLIKKQKRKIRRKEEAKKREQLQQNETPREISPATQRRQLIEEQEEQIKEQREQAEKIYQHQLWLEREKWAQEEWNRKLDREEKEKQKRLEIEQKIREEWEEQQKKEKEEEEVKDKKAKEKKNQQDALLREATANENKDGGGPWHNPIINVIPGKERETCPFFAKTGTCRFGERCSRGHPYPECSTVLLFPGMYSHFELEQGLRDEYDTDLILEYEDSEIYHNFQEFYSDIVPEFKTVGKVIQVKVCCNYEPHLRGNVYVQYQREEDAAKAFALFNGRYFGGRQLSCEYVTIPKWKSAICGLFGRGRCPKGRNCNFLHVFINPNNEFWEADKDGIPRERRPYYNDRSNYRHLSYRSRRSRSRSYSPRYRSKRNHRDRDRYKYSRSRSRSRETSTKRRSRSRERSRKERSRKRYSRSRSRSRDRKYSRSRSRDRKYSRSRSRSRERNKSKFNKKKSRSRSRSRSKSNSQERSKGSGARSVSRDKSISSDNEHYNNNGNSSDNDNDSHKYRKHKKHKKHKKYKQS